MTVGYCKRRLNTHCVFQYLRTGWQWNMLCKQRDGSKNSPHHRAPSSEPPRHISGALPGSHVHTQSPAPLCRTATDLWFTDAINNTRRKWSLLCALNLHAVAVGLHAAHAGVWVVLCGVTYSCLEVCLRRALCWACCSSSSSCSFFAIRMSFCTSWFFRTLVE